MGNAVSPFALLQNFNQGRMSCSWSARAMASKEEWMWRIAAFAGRIAFIFVLWMAFSIWVLMLLRKR